jgi:hypothetical protein
VDDRRPYSPPTARDVAGAWLFCALIATLALGLMGPTQRGMPPAAIAAAKLPPCQSGLGPACQSSVEAERERPSTVAGLHRLSAPVPHPGQQHRRG